MAVLNFISLELADNGDLAITFTRDEDQSEAIGEVKTIYVNQKGIAHWEHAAYYYAELMEDIDELLGWIDKYRRGVA